MDVKLIACGANRDQHNFSKAELRSVGKKTPRDPLIDRGPGCQECSPFEDGNDFRGPVNK